MKAKVTKRIVLYPTEQECTLMIKLFNNLPTSKLYEILGEENTVMLSQAIWQIDVTLNPEEFEDE
jgi:hypothetical protein